MTRSGTTLLRMMLDSHPRMAIPPETHFVPEIIKLFRNGDPSAERLARRIAQSRRFGDFGIEPEELAGAMRAVAPVADPGLALRVFYDLYRRKQGKKRWGEKTPGYADRMKRIEEALPEARFIHMIRDGRDVALSVRRKEDEAVAIKRIAVRWRRRVNSARRQGEKVAHYMELRYENLVTDPEAELRRVCEFIELDYRPAEMLSYHERAEDRLSEIDRTLEEDEGKDAIDATERLAMHERVKEPPRTDRVAVYEREMSEADRAEFENKAGELLAELGYETMGAAAVEAKLAEVPESPNLD